jgi:hypothetical protein
MIVGGFNGKFLSDYYIIHLDEASGKPIGLDKLENEKQMMQGSTLFPFQVPTIGDIKLKQAYTVDWQNMSLFFYTGNKWTYKQHVKH